MENGQAPVIGCVMASPGQPLTLSKAQAGYLALITIGVDLT
jgi:hypothetical protein